MPTLVEDWREFADRHGGFHNTVKVRSTLLFPDGATCDDDNGVMRAEPPADEYSLCVAKLRYLDVALKQLVPKFEQTKFALETQTEAAGEGRGSLPFGSEVDELRAMAAKIKELNQQRDAINEQIEQTPQRKAQRDAEARAAQLAEVQRQQAGAALAALRSINAD